MASSSAVPLASRQRDLFRLPCQKVKPAHAINIPLSPAQHNTMRRIARLDRSIDLIRARATVQAPSTYLCSACKHHASPFSTSALRAASNGKVPLTEKLRRKIWGTDNPPGLEDPYGDRSVFDQSKKKERRLEKEEGPCKLSDQRRAEFDANNSAQIRDNLKICTIDSW